MSRRDLRFLVLPATRCKFREPEFPSPSVPALKLRVWRLQASLEEDEHALDAARLAGMDGAGVQALLRRPGPVPLQEERARLLREVGARAGALLQTMWPICASGYQLRTMEKRQRAELKRSDEYWKVMLRDQKFIARTVGQSCDEARLTHFLVCDHFRRAAV